MDEIPGGDAFQNAINNFNKKAAGALFGAVKRILGTASVPFFRKDLGERFFTSEAAAGAVGLWVAGLGATWLTGNLVYHLLRLFGLPTVANVFGGWFPSILVGGTFIAFYVSFCHENGKRLQQFRNEGQLYHSFSRGVPRWESGVVPFAIIVVVFLFTPILGLLFLIACASSAKLEQEQQAMIYSRYLDALDQRIEKEFMEKALLGECEPQITYLAKPLPNDLDPDVRKDMAAAAVGKPVTLAAVGPKSRKKKPEAAARSPSPEYEITPSPEPQAQVPPPANPAAVAATMESTASPKPKSSRLVRFVVAGVIIMSCIAGLLDYLSHTMGKPKTSATPTGPTFQMENPTPAIPNPSMPAPQRVPVGNEAQPPRPSATPALAPVNPPKPDPAVQLAAAQAEAAKAQAALEAQKQRERAELVNQLKSSLANEQNRLDIFRTNCSLKLSDNDARIENVTWTKRKRLKETNAAIYGEAKELAQNHRSLINSLDQEALAHFENSQAELKGFGDQLASAARQMEKERQDLMAKLDAHASTIANTRQSGPGLIQVR